MRRCWPTFSSSGRGWWPTSDEKRFGNPARPDAGGTQGNSSGGVTFLQPLILFGLPLILLPVLIHLLNRLRHRPQVWGAMQFILAATRSSVDRARLKQFLILLFRVLAVLALILFLSRPFAGGWLGWAVSVAPDVIFLLVDRSASMETKSGEGGAFRREEVLRTMSEAAEEFEGTSHLVLVDSATRHPQTLDAAADLLEHPLAAATDAAADIPSMLQAALSWLIKNEVGNAEIWLGSDLQSESWRPGDSRWETLSGKLQALPQTIKIRIVSVDRPAGSADAQLTLQNQVRRERAGRREAVFSLEINTSSLETDVIPVEFTLNGVSTELQVKMDSPQQGWTHRTDLGSSDSSGWGSFALPADANSRNNAVYFVYGEGGEPRASVVGELGAVNSVLQIAAGDYRGEAAALADLLPNWQLSDLNWEEQSLVVWQEPLPGDSAPELESFIEAGGAALFLPPHELGTNDLAGIRWSRIEEAGADSLFRVGRWDRLAGPLSDTDEGLGLPLEDLLIHQRRNLTGYETGTGAASSLAASFRDGSPLLLRLTRGRGAAWFLTTLPHPDWSSLTDGDVLVPLVQRLLQLGTLRQEQVAYATAGELSPAITVMNWEPAGGGEKDYRWHAGVYRSEDHWLAVNRSPREDSTATVTSEVVRRLFGELPLAIRQEQTDRTEPLQGEAWRLFLLGMLIFLLVESYLTMPQFSFPKFMTFRMAPS